LREFQAQLILFCVLELDPEGFKNLSEGRVSAHLDLELLIAGVGGVGYSQQDRGCRLLNFSDG